MAGDSTKNNWGGCEDRFQGNGVLQAVVVNCEVSSLLSKKAWLQGGWGAEGDAVIPAHQDQDFSGDGQR